MLDQTVLDTSKVLLFVKSVDVLDCEKVGLFLETDEGLMVDWVVVKRVCGHFDKQHDWNDAGAVRRSEEPILMIADEMRRWLESNSTLTNVVVEWSGGVVLEELTKMVHNL